MSYHDKRCEVPSYCEPQPILHERIEESESIGLATEDWPHGPHGLIDYEILASDGAVDSTKIDLSIAIVVFSEGTTPESCLEDLFDAAIDLFERAKARVHE